MKSPATRYCIRKIDGNWHGCTLNHLPPDDNHQPNRANRRLPRYTELKKFPNLQDAQQWLDEQTTEEQE